LAFISKIALQVHSNANNVNNAKHISEEVCLNVQKSNNKMKQMLDSMTETKESSSKISKVIKVIDNLVSNFSLEQEETQKIEASNLLYLLRRVRYERT
jgi:methyl-accepting chemotaxis protein